MENPSMTLLYNYPWQGYALALCEKCIKSRDIIIIIIIVSSSSSSKFLTMSLFLWAGGTGHVSVQGRPPGSVPWAVTVVEKLPYAYS